MENLNEINETITTVTGLEPTENSKIIPFLGLVAAVVGTVWGIRILCSAFKK